MSREIDHAALNLAAWTSWAPEYVDAGRRAWAGEPKWGVWGIPEAEVEALPDVRGMATIELGCGTGYISAWLLRRGARRAVGVDLTGAQLATAESLQREFQLPYPLVLGNAETTPFADGCFDLAISEYGASIWCDPYRWIPEAARLLRTDGYLLFLRNSPLFMLCAPDDEGPAGATLLRDYFGLHRVEWADSPPSVEFSLPHGEMIRLLRQNGFEVERLLELRAPEGAESRYSAYDPVWARRWPAEEIWVARKRAEAELAVSGL